MSTLKHVILKHVIRIVGLAILPFIMGAVPAQKSPSRREVWNRPVAPFRILGNVYFVGTGGLGSYLITTPAGHILLDGALPESARQIEKHVESLGFHMRDVKYLLNTHAHYDHCGGLAELKRISGAKMIASRGDSRTLNTGFQSSYGAGWDSRFPALKVDRVIEDGGKLELGGVTVTAVLTPGHTEGCTTWTMPVTDAGKTYQAVFYCSTSVPGYPLVHNRYYPKIVNDYRHSFAVLEKLRCDVFLANHTEFFGMQDKLARLKTGGANPFVDSGEMARYVAESKQEFETELRKQNGTAR